MAKAKTTELDLLRRYVEKMDQFAELLRQSDEQIGLLESEQAVRKQAYEDIRDAVREAKDVQGSTVKLLLHFVRPGTIDITPESFRALSQQIARDWTAHQAREDAR